MFVDDLERSSKSKSRAMHSDILKYYKSTFPNYFDTSGNVFLVTYAEGGYVFGRVGLPVVCV